MDIYDKMLNDENVHWLRNFLYYLLNSYVMLLCGYYFMQICLRPIKVFVWYDFLLIQNSNNKDNININMQKYHVAYCSINIYCWFLKLGQNRQCTFYVVSFYTKQKL